MIERIVERTTWQARIGWALAKVLAIAALIGLGIAAPCVPKSMGPFLAAQPGTRLRPPELTGGKEWLGVDAPLSFQDLRGKIVLVHFWTLCCINCMQTQPEIARLEKKYNRQLVVIGVHSPKYESEKSTKSIRQAMLRYEIDHPVINDADRNLWKSWSVDAWPTMVLIDPEGYILLRLELERPKNGETLELAINQAIRVHRAKKTLNDDLLPFQKAREAAKGGPLYFPGRVLADATGNRLFISDSTHHRIVVTDLSGKHISTIGSGMPGRVDGPYSKAQFSDPQGLSLSGQTLYVADRRNHVIRAVDLKDQKVTTIAGTGRQGLDRRIGGSPLSTGLNSPWSVLAVRNELFIANPGSYQLWVLDNANARLRPFAGNGDEELVDGPRLSSRLAQPSGLTSSGDTLYWVDSESSSVRYTAINGKGPVRTIVGKGLFEFGDVDGTAETTRLQHPLDLVAVGRKLFVADTYNNKIKQIDPELQMCWTLDLEAADPMDKGKLFDEPGGISYANGKLYVADTNAHRIRVVDMDTKKVSTLTLTGVAAP
jgi:thiol-disulfide isomerase/thioredoxin